MKTNKISASQSFGNLYYTNSIVSKLGSSKFNKELSAIKDVISSNKFDKKRYVDIYLGHEDELGFFGIISSKKQGIPNNPYSRCPISTDAKSIKVFDMWLKLWNHDYSPKGLREWRELKKKAFLVYKNHNDRINSSKKV